MKFYKTTSIIGIIAICSIFIFLDSKSTNEPPKSISEYYEIKPVAIPPTLSFSGEKAPLHIDHIKERIDRELLVNTYWQSNGLLMFKRANKYFPIIEPILKENGVPDDFKYLALVESGLQNITSPAGAKGMWQIMKGTAKECGLEVNNNVDERYHLEKATRAACDYLKKAKLEFGSWTLAAAAYNAGISGISKALEKQQVQNYYELLLNSETERYVPRIIAIKEVLTHPKRYGFSFTEKDLYTLPETRKIAVDTAITNIASFAKRFGINYKIMKLHNPWLRENKLNNKSRKLYFIKIPVNPQK
ncbi:MAG: lytic transglycosylase domain-containing protein [Flavobacteriaceae bacterium]|nr:lytic transglycosylase domain-containing protein [Flavobacteriaceae bacterium]